MTSGVIKMVRNRLRPRIFRFNNKAAPRERAIFNGTQITVNLAVLLRANKKLGFFNKAA